MQAQVQQEAGLDLDPAEYVQQAMHVGLMEVGPEQAAGAS
jgi:hypothetical protein